MGTHPKQRFGSSVRSCQVSEWFVLDSSDLLRFPGPAARLDGHVLHVNGGLSAAAAQAAEAALGATVESPWETVPRRKWR